MMGDDAISPTCPQAGPERHEREIRRGASMECKKDANLARCNCSYGSCSRKDVCCDCLAYHLKSRELPACCFPADAERTYDRTFEHFVRLVEQGKR
jgi:hypothetical protein